MAVLTALILTGLARPASAYIQAAYSPDVTAPVAPPYWLRIGLGHRLTTSRWLSRCGVRAGRYDPRVVYIMTFPAEELASIDGRFHLDQRLTKGLPKAQVEAGGNPIVLVLRDLGTPPELLGDRQPRLRLEWMGVVAQVGTVGVVDASITVDPLRECRKPVAITGTGSAEDVLDAVPHTIRENFIRAVVPGGVGRCDQETWDAVEAALRQKRPDLVGLLDWLLAQAVPPRLNPDDAADRSWLEQQDALRNIVRIAEFPPSALAAWRRPRDRNVPYLAGLIPQPVEHGLIDHDIRIAGRPFEMFSEWQGSDRLRCDIHVPRTARAGGWRSPMSTPHRSRVVWVPT